MAIYDHFSLATDTAAGRRASDGDFSEEERRLVWIGETMHNIYQAVCRITVRKCDGDKCPTANLWLLAPKGTGVAKSLPDVFPGCRLMSWKEPELDERVKTVCDYLTSTMEYKTLVVPFSSVWKIAGYRDGNRLYRDYCTKPVFQQKLQEMGYTVVGAGRARRFVHCSSFGKDDEKTA